MASQIVLISGCSSGIGLATAVFLAKDAEKRFKVYATLRNLAKKEQLEEEGKDCLGDTLIIKQMDVCSDESVEKAVKEVLDAEGKIDVLFNNAGVSVYSPVECVPISIAQDMFNVNFFGTLRLIKAVLPSMKARQSGHIINNSSVGGIVGIPFLDIYSASKFAVEGLSESMAPLLQQFGIRYTLLEPGPIDTLLGENATEWSKTKDSGAADEKTAKLQAIAGEKFEELVSKKMNSIEVAAIVKEIIQGQNTNFRCLTNVEFLNEEIATKLKDSSTNKSIEMTKKRFFEKQKDNK